MSDRRRSKRLAEYASLSSAGPEPEAEVKVAKHAKVDAKSVKWVREEKALVSTVFFL